MMKSLQFLGAAVTLMFLGAVSAAPARAAQEGHFDKTLTVNGPVDLDVSTGSGDITIHPGSAGQVQIHARIRAGNGWFSGGDVQSRINYIEQHPPVEQDENTITIGHETDHELMRNISISYDISTPAETHLHSATGSGNLTVDGLAGPVDATTGSGDLRLTSIGAGVTARSGSGGIRLNGVEGNLRASTGSGDIRAESVVGSMSASTGSGDVTLTQTGAGDVEVSTGSGTVEVNGVKGAVRIGTGSGNISAQGTPTADWRLHTGSGDLTVTLPQRASFDVHAHTSSGSIHSAFSIATQGTISARDFQGRVGTGGPVVELRTSSGAIRIESR